MKIKSILLAAAAALIVYSCSTDRDDANPSETPAGKMRIEKIKTNNREESSKMSDSTTVANPMSSPNVGLSPKTEDPSSNEPGTENPVVDPTKPDKPW